MILLSEFCPACIAPHCARCQYASCKYDEDDRIQGFCYRHLKALETDSGCDDFVCMNCPSVWERPETYIGGMG